jgi:heme exporter protein C
MSRKADLAIGLLWVLTTPLMCVAIWMVFKYAPEEKVMGAAQKIFYFHVPSAMVTYAGVFVLLGASVAYLWTRNRIWDHVARAATETAILFCTIVLITGPIWAKPAWGIWWTWEARLTTTLILWLLLVASLMVRDYAQNRDLGARLAAVVAIVAAVDVPIIHKAVTWWRGQHPIVFRDGGESSLAPKMAQTFFFCMLVFFLLGALLTMLRYRAAAIEERTDTAMERLSSI